MVSWGVERMVLWGGFGGLRSRRAVERLSSCSAPAFKPCRDRQCNRGMWKNVFRFENSRLVGTEVVNKALR